MFRVLESRDIFYGSVINIYIRNEWWEVVETDRRERDRERTFLQTFSNFK